MTPWVPVILLVFVIAFLVFTLIKNMRATTGEETEQFTVVILCFVGIAACGFAIRYFATQLLSR
jgi:protein-S-isoprenylcysteine O-methyltransferase Ste14